MQSAITAETFSMFVVCVSQMRSRVSVMRSRNWTALKIPSSHSKFRIAMNSPVHYQPDISTAAPSVKTKLLVVQLESDDPVLSSTHSARETKRSHENDMSRACSVLYYWRMSIARISKYSASA